MSSFTDIIKNLKQKNYHPIYFLMGDEAFFIDQITQYIQDNVLNETEKAFNQTILYGKDVDIEQIVSIAKSFPMTAEYQIVIVKEAQHIRKFDKLLPYLNQPQPSTILVFNYKGKKVDKRTQLYKSIQKNALIFESKKLRDYETPKWILEHSKAIGIELDPNTANLLSQHLGNDLGRIDSELIKLKVITEKGEKISPEIIQKYIGISKEYNVFELQNALGKKQVLKANKIISYFAKNSKDFPLVVILSNFYSFFSKVLHIHFSENKQNDKLLASELKVNPYFVKDYKEAAKNYSPNKVAKIIGYMRQADLQAKGVNNASLIESDILKELIFKILH